MNRFVTIAALAALTPISIAQADDGRGEASLKETAGLGIGGVVGALAGGPIGFIVGAAGGAVIGDKLHRDSRSAAALKTALDESSERTTALETSLAVAKRDRDALANELSTVRNSPDAAVIDVLRRGVEIDILYRTDEFETPTLAREHLTEVAEALARVPSARVDIDGYADPRGDSRYNDGLSERRAAAVRAVLLAAGLDESQIDVQSHGAVTTLEDITHRDDLAFERRVNVRVYLDEQADGQLAGL